MSKGNSPAFPCQDQKKNIYTGMNLRDYFALEAMNALIKHKQHVISFDISKGQAEDIAKESYLVADAMLDERLDYK